MESKVIAEVVELYADFDKSFKIDLVSDEYIIGSFTRADDYEELKSKDMWRVIKDANFIKWRSTQNLELTELLNGALIKNISII